MANQTIPAIQIKDSNVGIGTTAPSAGAKLHVEGNIFSNNVGGNTFSINSAGANYGFILNNSANTFSLGYGTSLGTLGTSVLTWNSSGNVGIGTTAPSEKLEVVGIISSARTTYGNPSDAGGFRVKVQDYGGIHNDAGIGIQADLGLMWFNNVAGGGFYWNDGTSGERMRLTAAGNLGIGTTTPGGRLHIATPDPATNFVAIDFRNPTYGIYGKSNSISGRGNTLEFTATDFNTGGAVTTRDVLTLRPEGNVGIGTTSPLSILNVQKATNTELSLTYTTNSGANYTQISGGSINLVNKWATIQFKQDASEDAHHIIFSTANPSTNTTERMRITSAGNVGIGTTGPVGRLDVSASVAASGGVVGLVNLTNTNTGGNVVNAILPASTVADAVFYRAQTVSAGANDQYFFAGQTGNNTSITTNKVLITTNGAATFSSSVEATSFIKTSGTASQYLMADGSVSTLTNPVTGTGTTNYVPKFTSASAIGNSALQEVSGNLGLGVTPSAWGNATKAIQIGGYSSFVNDGNGANNVTSNAYESATGIWNYIISLGATRYRQSFGDHTWFIAPSGTAGNAITFTQAMTLDASGNLGIGTTAPKTKLDVNGTIGFGSKSMSMTNTFAAALTLNMNDHTGCYVKLTAFGDWGNHSTIAYLGEFFIQASAGGYNEPGIIIRQVDNTGGGDDIQAQILDPAGAGTRDFIIELKATSATATPFTAHLQYEVRGQYNSVS